VTCQRRPPERGEVPRNGPNIAEGVWEGEYGGDGEVEALRGYCGVGQSARGSYWAVKCSCHFCRQARHDFSSDHLPNISCRWRSWIAIGLYDSS